MIEKAFLILMHLFTTWAMWSFHKSFESSVRPRNFTFDTFGMRRPLMNKSGSSPGLYERVKDTADDLAAENLNFHFFPHFATLSK